MIFFLDISLCSLIFRYKMNYNNPFGIKATCSFHSKRIDGYLFHCYWNSSCCFALINNCHRGAPGFDSFDNNLSILDSGSGNFGVFGSRGKRCLSSFYSIENISFFRFILYILVLLSVFLIFLISSSYFGQIFLVFLSTLYSELILRKYSEIFKNF